MTVNCRKTKEMLIGHTRTVLKDTPPSVTLSGTPVQRVTTFNLPGVHVGNDLKWARHVDAISSKVSSRLYFLRQLKQSGAGPEDLLCFCTISPRIFLPTVALESQCLADKDN